MTPETKLIAAKLTGKIEVPVSLGTTDVKGKYAPWMQGFAQANLWSLDSGDWMLGVDEMVAHTPAVRIPVNALATHAAVMVLYEWVVLNLQRNIKPPQAFHYFFRIKL